MLHVDISSTQSDLSLTVLITKYNYMLYTLLNKCRYRSNIKFIQSTFTDVTYILCSEYNKAESKSRERCVRKNVFN